MEKTEYVLSPESPITSEQLQGIDNADYGDVVGGQLKWANQWGLVGGSVSRFGDVVNDEAMDCTKLDEKKYARKIIDEAQGK